MRRMQVRANSGFMLATAAALALAGCAGSQTLAGAEAPAADERSATASAAPVPGGVTRHGGSTASMADQYRPRAGTIAATGASAWVPPAPAPAFVLAAPLPPADPPAPPPAAVANRQPAAPAAAAQPAPARPSVAASDIVRPEAAAPSPAEAPAVPDPAVRTRGLALFNDYSCSACHAFADARAAGSIGPSLDRNPRLTKAFAVTVITNGQGAMPAFGGQMTDAEIAALAHYLVQFARR